MSQYHNVIIFGAGASANAGIPLLDSFVNKMWEYATRGKVGDEIISEADREILVKAHEIRTQLERYNTRASFNDRNLEDILSLLSFEALAGGENAASYETLVKAVARTVELSCGAKHHDATPKEPFTNNHVYDFLWRALLSEKLAETAPALITFNYDLVLERTLWQHFHNLDTQPIKSCGLKYFLGSNDFIIKCANHRYTIPHNERGRGAYNLLTDGQKPIYALGEKADIEIPYLKLHGSLNWNQDNPLNPPPTPPTQSVEKPLILPPVFNKMNSREIYAVWKKALDVLRQAKNIIVVGYSLPKTDIYMQYFLKSAVGPNSNLQKIIIFNPTLFQNNAENEEMKKRYMECFSPQFGDRIIFCPDFPGVGENEKGTFYHFVNSLSNFPQELFFYP
jgi:hypothetical protein